MANIKNRAIDIKKYDLLEVNEDTHIKIKLKVLDSCMFPAYLYGVETWWEIDEIADVMLFEETR